MNKYLSEDKKEILRICFKQIKFYWQELVEYKKLEKIEPEDGKAFIRGEEWTTYRQIVAILRVVSAIDYTIDTFAMNISASDYALKRV